MSIMSQTETKVLTKTQTQPFGFFDLKTVQWIGSVRAVDQVTKYTKEKTTSEQFPLMAWIVGTIEMFIISIYLFIHSLPWPDFMVTIIKRIDQFIENFLEYVSDKLDWAKNRLKLSSKRKVTPKPPEKNSLEQFFANLMKNQKQIPKTAKETESESYLFALRQYFEKFQQSQPSQNASDSNRRNSDPLIKLDLKINGKSVDPIKVIQDKSDEFVNTMKKQTLEELFTKLKNHYNESLNTEEKSEDREIDDLWWDVFMVRLIRLRDSIEALIDAFLSVCLFVVYKVIEFWAKVFNLWVEFLKVIFAPAIWIFKAIFPPPEVEKKTTSALKPINESYPTTGQNGANKSNESSTESAKVNEIDEQNRFSPTTSDCDSDVSVVSETWSIGHTDKYGGYELT